MANRAKFSSSSVPSVRVNLYKKDLNDIYKWAQDECNKTVKKEKAFLQDAAEEMRDIAQEKYLDAYYAGENDVTVRVAKSPKGTIQIIAEGEVLPFIEYGTGDGSRSWYFSTDGKNITMDGDKPRGGVWAQRRTRTDDPEKTAAKNEQWLKKANSSKSSKKFKEVLYQSPRTQDVATLNEWGESYNRQRMMRGMNPLPDKELNKWLQENVAKKFTIVGDASASNADSFVDARKKKYKAEYKNEESHDAVRTYGNRPHHIMSKVLEELRDKLDKRYGRGTK